MKDLEWIETIKLASERLNCHLDERVVEALLACYMMEDDTNKKMEIRRDLETIMGSYAPSLLFSDKPYLPAPPIQECSGEIKLGNVVQGGLTAFPFGISLDELNKHIAIFGSTGSGKANAPEKQH